MNNMDNNIDGIHVGAKNYLDLMAGAIDYNFRLVERKVKGRDKFIGMSLIGAGIGALMTWALGRRVDRLEKEIEELKKRE